MLRRSALARSGSFDPAFDRLPMEDHDLGLRLHLAGATLIYDPDVLVYHHHAPAGAATVRPEVDPVTSARFPERNILDSMLLAVSGRAQA